MNATDAQTPQDTNQQERQRTIAWVVLTVIFLVGAMVVAAWLAISSRPVHYDVHKLTGMVTRVTSKPQFTLFEVSGSSHPIACRTGSQCFLVQPGDTVLLQNCDYGKMFDDNTLTCDKVKVVNEAKP